MFSQYFRVDVRTMENRQQPKVFHLITRFLDGGAERVVESTVLGLDEYDFTVGFGRSHQKQRVQRLEVNGVETRSFNLLRHYNPLTAVPAVLSVANYLRNNEIDIIHTHSTEAGIIGRYAGALAEVPHIVHTVHGIPFTEDRNRALNSFIIACERLAARYTDRIVTNANVMTEEYLERRIGTRDQFATIHIGIELEDFRSASPASNLPGNRPRIVMISRLAEGKGIEVLLDAAEKVRDSENTFCIVGEGPLYEKLDEEIEARGLSNEVYLTGYRDDIPQVLNASDVFVLPSYREGTPRVIFEAMASGLPVVATDIAGIPEQIDDGETGYLIPTGDPEALAERLTELLENPDLRRRMGESGRERASHFSTNAMLENLDDLYQGLLASTDALH